MKLMKWLRIIWVSIPCAAGTPFRRVNEKLGAETGDLAMTCKLEFTAVGLCRHDVEIGDGFSWEWINCNEFWDSVVVRNFFARCGSLSCVVSTTAVGQQFVDREGGVFKVQMLEMFKKVTGAVHAHVFHHQLRAVEDNADDNGFNSSVQPYAVAVHSGLNNQNAAKHRWYYFPKMQLQEVLLFKQFESDTALLGRTIFNIDFVDPTVRPDAPERQSIECRAFPVLP